MFRKSLRSCGGYGWRENQRLNARPDRRSAAPASLISVPARLTPLIPPRCRALSAETMSFIATSSHGRKPGMQAGGGSSSTMPAPMLANVRSIRISDTFNVLESLATRPRAFPMVGIDLNPGLVFQSCMLDRQSDAGLVAATAAGDGAPLLLPLAVGCELAAVAQLVIVTAATAPITTRMDFIGGHFPSWAGRSIWQ